MPFNEPPAELAPGAARDRRLEKVGGVLFAVGYIVIAWALYYLWDRYQLLEARASDYAALAAIAFGVPTLLLFARARRERRTVSDLVASGASSKAFFGGVIIMTFVGGAALEVANGLLDWHSPRTYATTVAYAHCRKAASLTLEGAPTLPTADNAMQLDLYPLEHLSCYNAHVGDTVLLFIKPGAFGRPWVYGDRLIPAPDVAQQALARHRALVQTLEHRGTPHTRTRAQHGPPN